MGEPILKEKTTITTAMALGIFLVMLDTTIMNIALPAIQKAIGVNYGQLSWALNIYTIIFATFTIPLSKLGDIFGKSKIYVIGLFLFGLGSLCSGWSNTFELLIIGRILASLGASILLPIGNTIGLSSWSLNDRFKIVAILGLTQGGAAAVGPTLGGIITDLFGWHWIFLINVPMVLVGILLSMIALNFKNDEHLSESIDWMGSCISMFSLFLLTLGLIKIKDWGLTDIKTAACFLMSGTLGITFFLLEKSAKTQ